ncbi:hypothetical protein [Pseudolabrys sp.]|uniref:hypothetical protein n=1 Tax=Pseudolabrys sp. TaxID=1960880 RepID=UPI003D0F4310
MRAATISANITLRAVMAAAFILASYAAVAQEAPMARKLRVRNEIEQMIRAQYDWMISQMKPSDEATKQMAIEGLKGLSYMKAYAMYKCAVSWETQSKKMECLAENEKALRRFFRLSDYASVVPPERQFRCEMKNRLYDAEVEFPPFEFLRSQRSRLLDQQKFFECMTGDK